MLGFTYLDDGEGMVPDLVTDVEVRADFGHDLELFRILEWGHAHEIVRLQIIVTHLTSSLRPSCNFDTFMPKACASTVATSGTIYATLRSNGNHEDHRSTVPKFFESPYSAMRASLYRVAHFSLPAPRYSVF